MLDLPNTRDYSNLQEPVKIYLQTLQEQDKKNFLTALLKYCVPAFGFSPPGAKRMSQADKDRLFESLKEIPFTSINELLEKLSKYLDQLEVSQNSKYPLVSRIKKFVDTYPVEDAEKQIKIKKYQRGRSKFSCHNLKLTGRKYNSRFELKRQPRSLKKEINVFKDFVKLKLNITSESTFSTYVSLIKQYLGWLIYTKQTTYEKISLASIIPLVNLYNSKPQLIQELDKDNLKEYAYKKMMAEWECQDLAKETVEKFTKFFADKNLKPRSKEGFYTAMIALAKYIYKDETDIFLVDNFDDVPFITFLRKNRKNTQEKVKIYQKSNNQNTDNKLIPWEEVLKVVEEYRLKYETKDYRKPDRHKVKPFTTACDLQRFLMLSFFTVMPPDRRRTFVELTYGKSLKHGLYDENENFTSIEKLKDKSQAKYYIYLSEGDYKTWKNYGTWIGEIPNKEYSNGKKFYDYIDEWLFNGYEQKNKKIGYRYVLNPKPKTDRFFMTQNGKLMTSCNFSAIVRNSFYRITGKPVSPHTIRHIYVSHIHKHGYDDATLESIAYWMKHSSQVAKETYLHLKQSEKLSRAYQAINSVKNLH